MRGLYLLLALPLLVHGQSECAKCHAGIHRQWTESWHGKMVRAATQQSVEADFTLGKVVLRGSTYPLARRNGAWFIDEYRIDYTLGGRRIQQYLSTLPDGRIIVLPAAWDNTGKKWIHDTDVHNPEEPPGEAAQIWNKTCYSCHVSGGRKNFDLEQHRYRTTWQGLGIYCERCHGPGAGHIANPKSAIINPRRLDPARSSMICAQCHSLRDIYVDGFKPGANYYDHFVPVMQYRQLPSDDPSYWADGRPRHLANESLGLWQSQCFLKGGATCITCHSLPHGPNLRVQASENAACTKCHAAIAVSIAAHTHHAPGGAGSSCVSCHMPVSVTGLNAHMRDHSISVPIPENTVRYGIPNACNLCHKDKDAEWTLKQMNAWYGGKSRQKLIRRAEAFSAAQKGDMTAVPKLLQILSDPSRGPLVRANAAGFLGNFPNDPAAYDAVLHAFSDGEPLVRATAVLAIRPRAAQRAAAGPAILLLLKDDTATVRMNAAIALVAMGVRQLPGEDGERFERAKALYRARAELDSDDAGQQFAAGRFSFLSGDFDAAVAAFRAALKLDPRIPAQYYLGAALTQKGDFEPAREVLNAIPRNDHQYDSAQRLLAQIETQDRVAGPKSDDAQEFFREGQLLLQNTNYGPALQAFDQALQRAPKADWAIKAAISRAICLEKLARTSEAEAAMQALSGNAAAQSDVDLQLAYVELLFQTGRPQEALTRADNLVEAAPNAPQAHLWRARALLEMHRTGEAAKAAEESIRLEPDLAPAHNLLIRIYQMQGRTKEASQEAQWLREYQRQPR